MPETNPTVNKKQLQHIAASKFGYSALRPGQADAILALLKGHDTLAVMPTGSGKSAIYQIAADLIPGTTVVISPLIALQNDQVQSINEQNLNGADVVNSNISIAERQEAFKALKSEAIEFLFLAPEQFKNTETLERLKQSQISLFVIDEAHCISEWGHDFRPDYLKLGTVIESLGHPQILALTATASPPVRTEIMERLGMRNPQLIVQGFDRPNIRLGVERFEDETEKQQALVQQIQTIEKPGIVYAATRKHTEKIAELLCKKGIKAIYYHAGLKPKEREQAVTEFMEDQAEVIVATTAFGMGVDKPNVRFVFHSEISDSVDSYYQEIGRAGRDGKPAKALLFYRTDDLKIRHFLGSKGKVDSEEIEEVAGIVLEQKESIHLNELKEETELSQHKLSKVIDRLEDVGVLETLPTGEVRSQPNPKIETPQESIQEAISAETNYQKYGESQLEMMRGYAELRNCRREYLLNYFGEQFTSPCDNCDNCLRGIVVEKNPQLEPFPLNSRVSHSSWGEGLVMRYEGDKIVILFDSVGYKTLAVELVLEQGLLSCT